MLAAQRDPGLLHVFCGWCNAESNGGAYCVLCLAQMRDNAGGTDMKTFNNIEVAFVVAWGELLPRHCYFAMQRELGYADCLRGGLFKSQEEALYIGEDENTRSRGLV